MEIYIDNAKWHVISLCVSSRFILMKFCNTDDIKSLQIYYWSICWIVGLLGSSPSESTDLQRNRSVSSPNCSVEVAVWRDWVEFNSDPHVTRDKIFQTHHRRFSMTIYESIGRHVITEETIDDTTVSASVRCTVSASQQRALTQDILPDDRVRCTTIWHTENNVLH